MYLMNVPPVAVTTEWRTCGPPGGYSLHCFNDSDPELSTRGTPISDKVQMIIESLRSTQSSLEMGDELERNVLSGQDDHSEVCKVAMGSYVGANSKIKSTTETQQADASSPINHESSDSDSDGSVDRGIEEAIVEYLKEKGDNKRKADPCSTFLQASKIQRKNTASPDVSEQISDINTFMFSSNPYPNSFKVETLAAPAVIPVKKSHKKKASLNDNIVKTLDSDKIPMNKSSAFQIKVEEDSNDSSSDDGIEEAIQRYQLEKMEQQNIGEELNLPAIKGESDSTSDDGIEEAIRCYQLKQIKEKSVLKPFTNTKDPCSSLFIPGVGRTSIGSMNKPKVRKKKTRMEKDGKSVPPSAFISKNSLSENQRGNGNGLLSFKVEYLKDQPTPAPPKANTTAELMCAEAILDISKTVLPGVFHPSVDLGSCATNESPSKCSTPDTCPDEESDDSSIDSEDGIEQEIRNFLEQKAQVNKLPPCSSVTQEPQSENDPEKVKAKQVATQKKPSRLSVTQRRKFKEENSSEPIMSGIDKNSQTHPIARLHKTEQSGDKSSSLDSDEDLDTAIKDLLKTKKKTKKKTRDLKRQSRMCLNDEESLLTIASQTKKSKPEPFSKRSAVKKVRKNKDEVKDTTGLSQKTFSQPKQTDQSRKQDVHGGETRTLKGTDGQDSMSLHNSHTLLEVKEDSTSVDSDDSIEQEIRRFLAEKAKVPTAVKCKDADVSQNGTVVVCSPLREEDVKQENQLAEIPRQSITNPFSRQSLPTPQSWVPDISTVGAQSRPSSVQSCSPSILVPADGAGAARTEQRWSNTGGSEVQEVAPQPERLKPVLTSSIAHSRSESIKWRQSLGLPITDTGTLSRLPFLITSSKISKTASATLPYQSTGIHLSSQTPVSAWSSTRTSVAPCPWTTEKTVNAKYRSPVLNILSSPRQQPRLSFTQSQAPGHSSTCPLEGETQSMVHMPKDKSVFVELESNRTNHVQVRSRERSEGKEKTDLLVEIKKEGKRLKIGDKEMQLVRKQEEFVDEADCESVNRGNPEKKQGFSTLSLSSAIDPGITIRPCVALTTEERSRMFCRKNLSENCKKGKASCVRIPVQKRKRLQGVKRKLQFVPVDRRSEAPSKQRMTK
ncbi:protein phosphatase 1 regulatory subunit 26-like isoform X2 [Platichthys flesus]|uniref:protein phosphatase 1 regulatory subunit 26-like isoform X2 n=1 Tax=Platichthys flesus TaxID=8260 RepID=UPI002DB7DB3E|nr:protein phosphatase 1 regulatory subunit 26-like isoform X2 [Platichthys flesus]